MLLMNPHRFALLMSAIIAAKLVATKLPGSFSATIAHGLQPPSLCWRPKRTGKPEIIRRLGAYVLPRSQLRELETSFCARMVGDVASQNSSGEFVPASLAT